MAGKHHDDRHLLRLTYGICRELALSFGLPKADARHSAPHRRSLSPTTVAKRAGNCVATYFWTAGPSRAASPLRAACLLELELKTPSTMPVDFYHSKAQPLSTASQKEDPSLRDEEAKLGRGGSLTLSVLIRASGCSTVRYCAQNCVALVLRNCAGCGLSMSTRLAGPALRCCFGSRLRENARTTFASVYVGGCELG